MKRKLKVKGVDVLTICRKGTYQGYKKKTLQFAQIPLTSGTPYVANTLLSLCSALLRAPTLVHGTDVRTKRIFKVHPPVSGCDQTWLVKLTGICAKLINASAWLQSWFGDRPVQMTPGAWDFWAKVHKFTGVVSEQEYVHLKLTNSPSKGRNASGLIFFIYYWGTWILFLLYVVENFKIKIILANFGHAFSCLCIKKNTHLDP